MTKEKRIEQQKADEKQMHPQKVSVFIALKGGALMGPIPAQGSGYHTSDLTIAFQKFLESGRTIQKVFYFHLGDSLLTVDFKDVSSIYTSPR